MNKKAVPVLLLMTAAGSMLFGQESYEEWKRRQEAEFESFLSEEDRQFAEFLKTEWEEFQAFQANTWDPEPKPVTAPSVTPGYTKESADNAGKYFKKSVTVPTNPPADTDVSRFTAEYTRQTRGTFAVPFFGGTELYLPNPGMPELDIDAPLSNGDFSSAWLAFSEWDYQEMLAECEAVRTRAKLNDWGYFKLISGAAAALYPGDSLTADIVTWFLLVKSGYDVRAGYSADGRNMYILLPADNMIYDVLYFYFYSAGPYYYFFSKGSPAKNVGSFYTYSGDNPETGRNVTMRIPEVPKFREDLAARTLNFMYRGEPYSIEVRIDQNLVSLGEEYPQTDLDIYFAAPVSMNTRHSLIGSLQILVDGRSETEAVNFLLRFVQTAFEYQTDQQQFGIEKPMFVEETLFYPYADCEDRSILFSYLVEEITGLDVIALDYPGHIATAVQFSKPVSGDSVSYNGKRYVICDPTYINADIGMAMPRYRAARPKVIEIDR
jgi:hypothetical protein